MTSTYQELRQLAQDNSGDVVGVTACVIDGTPAISYVRTGVLHAGEPITPGMLKEHSHAGLLMTCAAIIAVQRARTTARERGAVV